MYISADRPDIGYTIRLLASSVASPTKQALRGLVKLVQYLLNTCNYATAICIGPPGSSKLLSSMDVDCSNNGICHRLECYSDADWAGSRKDRKSYGGASYCLDGCYLHYVCRAQRCISLSSMESEFYAAVSAACQGLFMKATITFMTGEPCQLVVLLDNASARQFALRQGVSKAAKHIEGRFLWLQDAVRQGRLQVKAVSTHYNLGDLFTKPFSPARLLALCYLHGLVNEHHDAVGEKEWEDVQLKHEFKQQVNRVKHQFVGSHVATGWIKKVALLTLLMPNAAEACRGASCSDAMSVAVLPVPRHMACCSLGVIMFPWFQLKSLRSKLAVAQREHVTKGGRVNEGSSSSSCAASSVARHQKGDAVIVIPDGGEAYHRYECQYVRKSSKPRKVYFACTQCFKNK